jgi:DnaJ like chaperone protein
LVKWKGKAIGAGLGFLFGGPFGAMLGTITGDFLDKTTFTDKELHPDEESMINRIIGYLEIDSDDAFEIRGEFCGDNDKHYRILNTTRNSSNEDIKKAYRLLSKKYHPDKVSHLGDEFATLASDKFQKINNAYEEIKKEKGF